MSDTNAEDENVGLILDVSGIREASLVCQNWDCQSQYEYASKNNRTNYDRTVILKFIICAIQRKWK